MPAPDAGVPRELVKAARERIRYNGRISKAEDTLWELSGRVFLCGGCGNRMVAHRSRAGRVPGDLDSERRRHVYDMMKLRMVARVDGRVDANGERTEEVSVGAKGTSYL